MEGLYLFLLSAFSACLAFFLTRWIARVDTQYTEFRQSIDRILFRIIQLENGIGALSRKIKGIEKTVLALKRENERRRILNAHSDPRE